MDVEVPTMLHHLSGLDFTADGSLFLAASNLTRQYWMGQLWYFIKPEYAPERTQATAMIQSEVGINDIACLPSETPKVLCGLDSGAIELWELQEEILQCTAHAQAHDDFISSLHVCADHNQALSSSPDHRIKVWDLQELKSICTFRGHTDTVYCAAPHPTQADIFISCSQDGKLILWDRRLPKPASITDCSSDSVPTCVSWQPDTEHSIVVGKECGSLVYRDCRRGAGQDTRHKLVHSRPITRLAFAPHRGDWVASGSEDCMAAVSHFDNDSISVMYQETRHKDFVQGVAWNPSTNELYTCAWDSQLLRSDVTDDALETVKEKVRQMDVIEATTPSENSVKC